MLPASRFLLRMLCTVFLAFNALAAERTALVIGNNAYPGDGRLENPARDARAVGAVLQQAGFEVLSVVDATVETFYESLERLKQRAAGGKIGLIFYAGHGVEVDGKNYLLPVDAELETSAQLRTQAVALDTVLGDLKSARCAASLVILDCCRNNPLRTRSWMRSRSIGGGLAELGDAALPESTMVMFSAGPGQQALDGTGENSPFTAALVKHMQQPGLSLFDAFIQTSDDVSSLTQKRQEPWVKFDGAGRVFREFSFNSGTAAATKTIPVMPPAATPPPVKPAVAAPKPVEWSKGSLKASLESFTLHSPTRATAVVKLANTSPDKHFKLAFDWQNPAGYSPNPPPGSTLNTAAGAALSCIGSNGITPLTYLEANQGRGVLGTPEDVIAQADDLGPNDEMTLTLNYGLASEQRGFGLSTDRDQKPASSDQPPANARHRLTIGLWQAEVKGGSFGRPARVSIQLSDIPQSAP